MFPRIITAEPLPTWHIKVQFADGLEKVMDLSPFIRESGISAPLRDEDYFAQLFVEEGGGLAWPNGFDFCPVFLRQDVPAVVLDKELMAL